MREFAELLVERGEIARRYLITDDRHDADVLDAWRPLVGRLLDHPDDRQYHAYGHNLPYWDASLTLSPRLRHPDLDPGIWLCMYASRQAIEPGYVGLIVPRRNMPWVLPCLQLSSAMSGAPGLSPALYNEVEQTAPVLVGSYWGPGLPRNPHPFVRAVGECAAILAQLVLEGESVGS